MMENLETSAICNREPIHAPGAIQPHGALLAIDCASRSITHASANLDSIVGVAAESALGRQIDDVLGDDGRSLLARLDQRARAESWELIDSRGEFRRHVNFLHVRAHGSGRRVVIDIEPSISGRQPGSLLTDGQSVLDSFAGPRNRIELCEFAVRGLRSITGFDHVMAYRFGEGGDGEVIAEARDETVPSYLGLHFPAGDVPTQARQLYLRQRVGNLVNRDYVPVPILVDPASDDDAPLDLTRSALRGVSPIHIEYMRNMGTVATLRIGLTHRAGLWGLLVCNHMSPHAVEPQTRALADLIGQTVSLLLGSLGEAESYVQRQARADALKRIVDRLSAPAPLFEALASARSELLDLLSASGAILRGSGKIISLGRAPIGPIAERLLASLSDGTVEDLVAIGNVGERHPEFARDADVASGALMMRLEPGPDGDALVWLRPEFARTVVWGGDPKEHARFDRATGQIHPRASFSAWRETVKGRSAPWTESDLALAADLRRAIETETAHRTKAELALKSNSLEITLRHMNQGIMMIDADHRVQVCNDGALRSLGLAKSLMNSRPRLEEIVEDLARERRSGGEALLQDLRDFLPEVRLADEPRITERTGPDGVVYEVRSMPMPGGGVVSTYTDVTLRKETEAKLRVARDQAQAATHAKSEFLATMSHEIRSPLSGLVGLIELLRETKLEPEQLQMANMAHDSALALLAVLNDVLTFSKIEAKGLSIMPEAVRLRDLVAAVVEPHRLEAARKSVVLTWSADPALPDCVSVDPLRLRQILNNLLSNAVKFTLSGDIELRVELAGDGSGAQMTFSARDSGIGMTEAVLGRLFEPFVQADASTTRDFGGTGLGLSISSRLARMLGGTLTASSRHGVGSTFVLTLPLLAAETPDASDAANAAPAPAIAGRGARVLVVDDDPSIRWLTKRQLELLGLTAVAAENGESALELLRAERFDLVLTDCHMPRMDGIALARAIRGEPDPRLRGIPIVGLTADVTETQRDRALAAGMAEVGMKPLSRAQLSQLLARHLPSGAGKNPEVAHAPAPARPSVAFDDETYKDLFEGDDLEGKAWLDEYFAMADSLVVELQRFVGVAAEADLPRLEIAEAAHALAGASLSVGATRVGEEARALQYAAAGDAAARLIDRQETLRKELDAAKTAVSEFLAGSRAAA